MQPELHVSKEPERAVARLLADQATLWRVLQPERIGIRLTEGFMMDPEASVSALVFHHPAAKYFKAAE